MLNYIYLFFYILREKPDILHIQWLPFIEYTSLEKVFLSAYKKVHPRMCMFLTVHNIYPHNCDEQEKPLYRKRFLSIDKLFDGYLAHLNSAKVQLIEEFGISASKITVAYHGIYVPDVLRKEEISVHKKDVVQIIMYGFQTRYKGADILIDAYGLLPKHYQNLIHIVIVGKTDDSLYNQYIEKAANLGIEWINKFVPNDVLYEMIYESDAIVLPYREISQSGVLLLAISYKKCILTSDLPSFKETLEGYPDSYFFKKEDPSSLAVYLQDFINGNINKDLMVKVIEDLNNRYSWHETALSTIGAYNYGLKMI